jgi:phospholipid transport system substrate-binding protein
MLKVLRSVILAFVLPGLWGLMILGADVSAAHAQDESAAVARTHDEALKTPPGKFIQDLGDRAIAAIADKNLTPNQRSDKFRQILTDSFDLKTIGRFVIGRNWNAASPDQQKEYMHLFEELVIKSYGDRLSLYTGEGFQVVGVRAESERDFYVNSQITHPDGSQPTTIDWRVRQREGKLGVIDVVVEGVSLSVTQQQEYAAVIQRSGGQIDGLLDQMRQQLQTPSGPPANQHG